MLHDEIGQSRQTRLENLAQMISISQTVRLYSGSERPNTGQKRPKPGQTCREEQKGHITLTVVFSVLTRGNDQLLKSLSVSRTVSQLIMRGNKPTFTYKLTLQKNTKGKTRIIGTKETNRPFLRRFPFVTTNRRDHSRHNENFTFNQNYQARSVKSYIACTKVSTKKHFSLSLSGYGPADQF